MFGAPGSITKPTRASQTHSDPCLGSYGVWFRGLQTIWHTLDVAEQSISLNSNYNGWITIHYHFWIILAIIFFNIQFFASQLEGNDEKRESLKHISRYTETITRLSDSMVSIAHTINVTQYFFNLIWADETRNRNFINGAKMLQAPLVFAGNSYLVGGWNKIPMWFRSISDIKQKCNEMLAGCKSELGFERQYDIFGWKRVATSRKRGALDGKCLVEKRSKQKLLEEREMKKKSAKCRVRSADGDGGATIQASDHWNVR